MRFALSSSSWTLLSTQRIHVLSVTAQYMDYQCMDTPFLQDIGTLGSSMGTGTWITQQWDQIQTSVFYHIIRFLGSRGKTSDSFLCSGILKARAFIYVCAFFCFFMVIWILENYLEVTDKNTDKEDTTEHCGLWDFPSSASRLSPWQSAKELPRGTE